MLGGEAQVGADDGFDGVGTGPSHRGAGELTAQFVDGAQGQLAAQAVQPVDVGVERLGAHAEALGDRGEAHGVERPLLLEDGDRGVDDDGAAQSHAC